MMDEDAEMEAEIERELEEEARNNNNEQKDKEILEVDWLNHSIGTDKNTTTNAFILHVLAPYIGQSVSRGSPL